ncbi:transcriptional regulator, TetR family [Rhodococcus wratislaviensis]|uniref:Transcriptional regulator, TetR family n=1 Tax=Rhodococcus wratislaviensis TaxID=44752 RepID=A0A402CKR8_RHOWR|nr:TetR/AcrR family transcriptional regulator [Rhodococcus wratislaviensis]GCE44139.1 transcriptional regulator, TetR family [Rhodococcus wratislaviensis]
MARPLDHAKRTQLLADVVGYIAEHGLADLSLRPLAAELGTSSRMLIYYFGTKEELLVQALATQHPGFSSLFSGISDRDGLRAGLEELWTSTTRGESSVSTKILLQVMGVASVQRGPFSDFATSAIHTLIDAVADAMVRCGISTRHSRDSATVAVSGLRGILLDRLVTGDAARTDRSASRLIEQVVAE